MGVAVSAIGAIDHGTVAAFLASPEARQTADSRQKQACSMNSIRTSLRVFFRYLHEAGAIGQKPARLVRRAICGTPPPRSLAEPDARRFLATIRAGGCTRAHALFHLMLAAGIPVKSSVALDVGDVELDRGQVRLGTMKGDRPATAFLGKAIRGHLRRYIADRTSGPLFPGRGTERLSTRHVQRRIAEWLNRAGVSTAAFPHRLRHGFAMRLYCETGDLALVQAALCHRSNTSTLVYARVDDRRLRVALG